VNDGQRVADRTGRTTEVVAAVLGLFLGFVLSQPFVCVTGQNGAAHTECQNLLMMSFSPPYWTLVGLVGGIAGATLLWTSVRLARRFRQRRSMKTPGQRRFSMFS
jgi:hypothetical protein